MGKRMWLGVLAAGFVLCACGQSEPPRGSANDGGPGPEKDMKVLQSSFAGSWYPGREKPLRRMLEGFLADVDEAPIDNVRALILPHAGYAYSGATAAYGVKQIAGQAFTRVIVMGPSHRYPLVNEASLPDATHYGTPLGDVPLDTDFIEQLLTHDLFRRVRGLHENEHSVQMEIPLLQYALDDFQLVPIVVGQLDADTTRRMAELLRGMMDQHTLVVASTDFTHYGPNFDYVPFEEEVPERLRELDLGAFAHLERKDVDGFRKYCQEHQATICGRYPVSVLISLLSDEDQAHLLHYDTSGRITDDYENSVSYISAAFAGPTSPPATRQESDAEAEAEAVALTDGDQSALLHLARQTIAFRLAEGKAPSIDDLDIELTPGMEQKAGAFVTLTQDGRLRGCIGELRVRGPLYRSVMTHALNAAFDDPRFSPVTADEWPGIEVEISALSPMRTVEGPDDIVVGRHGVVLRKKRHSAVYLPQVAPEQGWDVPETLSHLAEKAGLGPDGWKKGANFEVFEATVFSEHER